MKVIQRVYTILAKWDDEAKVWYVAQSDIPGLVTEAATAEQFLNNVCELAADLIELNSVEHNDVPLELMWSGTQRVRLANC